ncbi:beta-propeller fold lactonase family protein [Pseudomonas fluorescens]|uniref:YNCE-like beta-propeller domain-containing protein n=1 Tax=Pseudomonas fluorescens TaxID=294 RepID=A0A423LBN1_PSEFL|nr:beta-propeller fold lactonase family protein [Pseudomonas fluorescens]RON65700.1 hypothetical protein BK671_17370 [Pseudomonas fluorescens]
MSNLSTDTPALKGFTAAKASHVPIEWPLDVAISTDNKKLYVCCMPNILAVIDTKSLMVTNRIELKNLPDRVICSPCGGRVYIGHSNADEVSVVDAGTEEVIGSVAVASQPAGMAVHPDGDFIYVCNEGGDCVSVISAVDQTVVHTIMVGEAPKNVAFSPDGTRAYVTNQKSGTVTIVDATSHEVRKTVAVSKRPNSVVFDPQGRYAYIDHEHGYEIVVIEVASETVDSFQVANISYQMIIDQAGTHLYTVDNTTGTVSTIDIVSRKQIKTLVTSTGMRGAVAGENGCLYVTDLDANVLRVLNPTRVVTKANIINVPFIAAPASHFKDIRLTLTADEKPVKGVIAVTLPLLFRYADGGCGTREFVTDDGGMLVIRGVKGSSAPGSYLMEAAHDGEITTAQLTITAQAGTGVIPVGEGPTLLLVSPDGRIVFTRDDRSETVSMVDVSNHRVITTFPNIHGHLAINRSGNRLYVANGTAHTIAVIDTQAQEVVRVVSLMVEPAGIAVSPDGCRLFVCAHGLKEILTIDVASMEIISTLAVAGEPHSLFLCPSGDRAYVALSNNLLVVIDIVLGKIIGSVDFDVAGGGFALSGDGQRFYMTMPNSLDGPVLLVIDARSLELIKTISVDSLPLGVAVSPDSRHVYVTSYVDHVVVVIDAEKLEKIKTINAGSAPFGITVSANGERLFVTDEQDNNLLILEA